MTANIKTKDEIKIKIIGSARNRTRQTYCSVNLICTTKVVIKERDAIKIVTTGERNSTPSNYA